MKLDDKGYAITLIVFGILIVFIVVLSTLLITMNNSVKLNKTVKESVVENIQLGADTSGISLTERIEQLELQMSNIKQEIYPVGSIYMSAEDDTVEKVKTRFGGIWEKYAQGRTLVGEGTGTDKNGNVVTFTNNSTDGEYVHTLTISEMPSHTHEQDHHLHIIGAPQNGTGVFTGWVLDAPAVYRENVNAIATSYGIAYNKVTGGSESHNNIQPYITVYMYKRIN